MESKVRAGLFIGIVALLAIALSVSLYMERRGEADSLTLRVGVDDGITGIMMADVALAAERTGLAIDVNLFADCCGNAAQWAINSGELDVGFFCPGIADVLVSLNNDLEIYGPAVMNSEVMAFGAGIEAPATVAVPFQRYFLNDLVYGNFPSVTEIMQAAPDSLPFALMSGRAEGAVLDTAQALLAPDFVFMPLSGEDYISYCLVVRKGLTDSPQFKQFLETYNLIADEYNDPEFISRRFGISDNLREMVNVRFVYLQTGK